MRIILMIDMERNRFGSMHGKIPDSARKNRGTRFRRKELF
jgi:hypothetical protein